MANEKKLDQYYDFWWETSAISENTISVLLSRPLGGEQIEPLLDSDPLPGVLVLWREPEEQKSVKSPVPGLIYSMNQYHLAG